jgi:hypothetical protein
MNVVPSSAEERSPMVPRCAPTISRAMKSPSPTTSFGHEPAGIDGAALDEHVR